MEYSERYFVGAVFRASTRIFGQLLTFRPKLREPRLVGLADSLCRCAWVASISTRLGDQCADARQAGGLSLVTWRRGGGGCDGTKRRGGEDVLRHARRQNAFVADYPARPCLITCAAVLSGVGKSNGRKGFCAVLQVGPVDKMRGLAALSAACWISWPHKKTLNSIRLRRIGAATTLAVLLSE